MNKNIQKLNESKIKKINILIEFRVGTLGVHRKYSIAKTK